ncbi:30S ribosomal protein S7 [[Mycoplasma] mobile]|uniref:Small ribosomal subunit protein uS7 n=1 Tax=Mycoplasma mobile (strain ATCC 43663 / 163K / NCTC 11711) TaxID=267748 RepID=RS7_MYCM1|nr:30S ribosomal protein S7 [[Mycoplasma] mobile]Q6KHS4.1 RecName: Full=Small ribosomal subunit protein uS7; AltName: Full=30S ribosomal protein S7 [Mycoplasma mobile 163K]AAT27854.1 30S ribosomal protein s7 [Mycoplasma mobile 163K]
MSRRKKAPIRQVLSDPIFNSKTITKLINTIMLDGKKSIAERILYQAFEIIKTKTNKDPMEVFQLALDNITPQLEVKTRRVGGTNYQVPMEVTKRRKETLSLRWLIHYSRLRSEKTMQECLANEIIDASNKTGSSIKKREDTHKMAEANKAFAHFRW